MALGQNIISTSSLPKSDPRRYDDGTPKELASAMLRTWEHTPTSERIVEDVMRYPIVIQKIVEYKGGVVPDLCMQHEGCSKRKRKATEQSRMYSPPPEVSAVATARMKALPGCVSKRGLC